MELHAVVVGVDGSAESQAAALVAAAEAVRRRLALRVVCTYPPPPTGYAAARWRPRADAHRVGAGAVEAIRDTHPELPVDLTEMPGDLAGTLVDQSRAAALVVVARADSRAGLLGRSAATRVATHAVCPVLVSGPERRLPVLLGLDGTEAGAAAVPAAFEEAALRGVPLHVLPVPGATTRPDAVALWADKHPEVDVSERSADGGELMAADGTAGIVVIGQPAAGRLAPTVRRLVHHATCQVLVVPAG